MRTNIVLEDELIEKTMEYSRAKTKREAVYVALREYVDSRERRRILEMFGSNVIDPDYDYKAARAGGAH